MSKQAIKNATTGLAGAVALAGGSQAYGAVTTVTVPSSIAANASNTPSTVYFDINGDGVPDFQFTVGVAAGTTSSGVAYAVSYAGIAGAYQAYNAFGTTNQVVGYANGNTNYASRLANGTSIGSNSTFVYGNYLTVLASRVNENNFGALGTRGFVGLEFEAADGIHFGYIDLQSIVTGTGSTDTDYTAQTNFYSAAYESTPNTAIAAGAVPEPTSLAALACGVAGTVGAAAYRRKKAAQAAA